MRRPIRRPQGRQVLRNQFNVAVDPCRGSHIVMMREFPHPVLLANGLHIRDARQRRNVTGAFGCGFTDGASA